jgi:nucleoside-diphosphate-sugar epimerase
MKLTDKQILITGADGFIGSHLTEILLDMGCRRVPA